MLSKVKASVTSVSALPWNGSNNVELPKIVVCVLLMLLSTLSLGNAVCSSASERQCTNPLRYCFSLPEPEDYYEGSCEDGQCRCPDSNYYDYCTCLPHVSSCLIQKDSNTSIGTPTTDGDPESTYSCVASDNCDYEVHVIGNYESSNGRHGFFIQRQAGDTYVYLTVSGQSSRPLILVFVSYEPVRWRLSVPSGVQINRVIVSGYYNSTVTATSGNIGLVETLGLSNRLYGYGTDIGGGSTAKLLAYLVQRFGPVTSFSGSYRADRWTLNINRSPECTLNKSTHGCSELQSPPNGHVNISTSQPEARYSCNKGFSLSRQETRTCLPGGTWTGLQPICTPVLCPRPGFPFHGTVNVTGLRYTSVATYSCFDGYVLFGLEQRTCEANGAWSGYTPLCVRDESITCTYKCPDGTCVDARDDCGAPTGPTVPTITTITTPNINIDSSEGNSNNKSRTVGITVGSIVTAIVLVTAVLLGIARLLLHISRASTVATTQNDHESSRPNEHANDYEISVRFSPAQLQHSQSEQQKTQFSSFDQPPPYSTVAEVSSVEPPPPYSAVKNIVPANTAQANI